MGGGVVLLGVYCEVSQGVGLMLLLLHYSSSSLFHYYPIHTPGVDTSNKSSTKKKMYWEQNPSIMFFNPCPKTRNNKEYWTIKHTHHFYPKKKKIHTTRGGGVFLIFLGQGYVPVK